MSEQRFVCIDVGYGDDWYITDNGKRLSEMEIVDLLNKQQATISALKEENEQLKHWNNCLAEKRHEEKGHNDNLIKKLIGKIDFLERIIEGNL